MGPVDLAFTDRYGGAGPVPPDLDLALGDGARAENLRRVTADFAPGARVADMRQVHGNAVQVVGAGDLGDRQEVDALVSAETDVVLVVRVADCVPVLLSDADAGVVAVAHAGRAGMVAGVVAETVASMRELGAWRITASLGPRICGGCYEVPAALQEEFLAVV